MRPGLRLGAVHVVRYVVPVNQTVPDLFPALAEFRRGQPVFATGFMVGLMEAPCMAAVYPYLESGEASVGTMISMQHRSATVPGTALRAEARATVINGRSVHFSVVVTREDGEIAAAGKHALRIIDLARFHDRLAGARGARAERFPEPATLAHARMPEAIAA